MKFSIFAIIVGLCLVAGSVKTDALVQPDSVDLEYVSQDFADELLYADEFSVFGPMYFVIRASLRTLKGVNCTIKGVNNLRLAALKFISDIDACGVQVTKQLQSVINACQAVISTCNDIININENVCNNGSNEDDANANQKTGFKCFTKLLGKMLTLKKQVGKTITLVKKVPQAADAAGQCVTTAADNLTTSFNTFPTFVKACSKLTSN